MVIRILLFKTGLLYHRDMTKNTGILLGLYDTGMTGYKVSMTGYLFDMHSHAGAWERGLC